jgi:hypothetical protein
MRLLHSLDHFMMWLRGCWVGYELIGPHMHWSASLLVPHVPFCWSTSSLIPHMIVGYHSLMECTHSLTSHLTSWNWLAHFYEDTLLLELFCPQIWLWWVGCFTFGRAHLFLDHFYFLMVVLGHGFGGLPHFWVLLSSPHYSIVFWQYSPLVCWRITIFGLGG